VKTLFAIHCIYNIWVLSAAQFTPTWIWLLLSDRAIDRIIVYCLFHVRGLLTNITSGLSAIRAKITKAIGTEAYGANMGPKIVLKAW